MQCAFALFVVLAIRKLAGVLTMTWLWVTSPLWIGAILWTALLVAAYFWGDQILLAQIWIADKLFGWFQKKT